MTELTLLSSLSPSRSFAFLGVSNNINSNQDNSSSSKIVNPNGAPNERMCFNDRQCLYNNCVNGYCAAASSASTIKNTSYVAYFFLLVSLFWGAMVVKNITHATVAGTVATWWYSADSKGATGASLKRSCTTSLGSICLGSLIVAILQALRTMAEEARRNGDVAACCAECILGCLQSLMEYFNRWAFIYVGIYGYKFTDAGKAVFELFRSRGWDAIINDDLVGNALGFAALGIGMLCAFLGYLFSKVDSGDIPSADIVMAILGFFFGVSVSMIPLSVVDSAIATIFVCFAEVRAIQSKIEVLSLMM
jgi:hypothetical protein